MSAAPRPSRRALEFVRVAVSDWGEPAASGTVRLRCSQAELGRYYGVAPGTVSWYLGVLGDAVLARTPAILVDVEALQHLEGVEAHGRLRGRGMAPPSFVGPAAAPLLGAVDDDGQDDRDGWTASGSSPSSPSELDEAFADAWVAMGAVGLPASVLRALSGLFLVLADVADSRGDPRERPAGSRGDSRGFPRGSRGIRGSSADPAGGTSQDETRQDKIDDLSPLSCLSVPADPAETRGVRDSRGIRGNPRIEALNPLVEACDRLDLPGISHLSGLLEALSGYEPAEIENACRRLARDLANGAPIRAPFGLLVAKAIDGDRTYFSVPAATAPPASTPDPSGDERRLRLVANVDDPSPEPEADDEAVRAVRDLTSDPARAVELAALDAEVERRLTERQPGPLGQRLLRMAPLRNSLRADVLRGRFSGDP